MKYSIPFIKPSFPEIDKMVDDYKSIVEANWYTNFGPFEKEFTTKLEEFVGQETYVATVSSATAGLFAAILATLGRGDGTKYIIVPSFTFIAGPQSIIWCGYKPYFIDIDKDTLQADPEEARSILLDNKDNIAGILFCNAFGVGDPNIDKWESLANTYETPLIIDSAAGFGSKYTDNTLLGSRGECEIFSFHATKPFAIGEGGAVFSKSKELIDKIISIQNFGFEGGRNSGKLGFNGKMQEVNAAIGIRQLGDYSSRLKQRQNIFHTYKQNLKEYKFQDNAENSSICFVSALLPEGINRDNVVNKMNKIGIQIKEYYNPPVHKQDYFINNPGLSTYNELNNTEDICKKIISLPVHDNMKNTDIDTIINELNMLTN